MSHSEHLIAKLTHDSDWAVFNLDHVDSNDVCYYLVYGDIVSEMQFYRIGQTPSNFVESIKILERRFERNFDNPSVCDDELRETEMKISKMKQLYNRLSLHQYAKLD